MKAGLPLFHALALAALAGFTDAVSYVLFGAFTAHITGSTALAAIHLATRETRLFWSQATAIAFFVSGTAVGALLARFTLRIALGLEIFLFLLAYLVSKESTHLVAVALTGAAMGVQNGSFKKAGKISIHTTFLTGVATQWVTEELHRSPDHSDARVLLGSVPGFFFIGAALGALCALRIHQQAILVMAAGATLIAITPCMPLRTRASEPG